MVDPLTAGAIAAPIIGGIMGGSAASSEAKRARRAYEAALAQIAGVRVPTVEEQQLVLERPELVGEYQAMLEQTPEELATQMAGVSTDPRLAQAQMQALQSLTERGEQGLSAMDRAAFDQLQRSVAQQEQSRQQGILQNMAQRGVGGSGMELAARLQSSQNAADRAQQEAMQLAAQSQQARLQALAQAGALGGNVRQQEFGEKSDVARAKDVMSQFNLQNQLANRQRNIEEQRRAQAANLGERQRIAEAQSGISREQEMANKGLIQQHFSNEMQRAQAMAGQQSNLGALAGQRAAATGQMYANIGSGVGSAFAGLATKKPGEERAL